MTAIATRTAAAALTLSLAMIANSQTALPRIIQKDNRYALLVDGKPYLILGAQVNNSSAWPATLPKVWPAIQDIHANTVEMPVYWEQFEPQPEHFDYTVIDTLLQQAREHNVHLVLLWFGTWKNGSQHYMPEWMKLDERRYPHIIGATGQKIDSPSPHSQATLDADIRAFTALMRHLKENDPQHVVLLVQVENEAGAYGSVRDYSPEAQKLFEGPVPNELLKAMNNGPRSGDWKTVFGEHADEYFHAWSVAHFIGQVAAAGKAVYPLPMYVNAALRDPINPGPPSTYESGGPTDNVIWIYKAAAPAIDLICPDIYQTQYERYMKVLDLYGRKDNPLFVPETGNNAATARFFFAALGHGSIGFSPFGIDYTAYSNEPLGAARLNAEALAPFALNYRLMEPMDREIAELNFEGKLQAVVEQSGNPFQSLAFPQWRVNISYGVPPFGPGNNPAGNPQPIGRMMVAQLGPNEFLVAGFFCRVDFQPSDSASKHREFLRVEEGAYHDGVFTPERIWNGDQTDWGLNFSSAPQLLRVTLTTY